MTPKKILTEHGCVNDNDSIDRKDAIEAMKEYARQEAENIVSWLINNENVYWYSVDTGQIMDQYYKTNKHLLP